MTVSVDMRIGTDLAGYRIEELLGRGATSVVYRAEDGRLKRTVALKVLAPELAADERYRERFVRESATAVSLDHPNIVPVYDAGEVDGLRYIAMRLVEGSDLEALLRREAPLDPPRALALVRQIGDALDAAHARSLVHRDVKPSNVLVTGQSDAEHCYLADFGLTKGSSDRTALTDSGRLVGTIDYVAPEQIHGGHVDGRADVYSLACVLYRCLTGDAPFRRGSDVAVIYAHLEDAPPSVSERRADIPRELDAVVARGMAKLPDDRWSTCGELTAAAHAALAGVAPPLRIARASRRTLRVAGAVVAVSSAVVLAALFLARGKDPVYAPSDTLLRIDPVRATVTRGIDAPGRPAGVTTCSGSVFLTSSDGTVFEVDPRTSDPHPIRIGGTPGDISHVGDLAMAVIGPPKNAMAVIASASGDVSDTVALPGTPSAAPVVAALGTEVWIANPNAHELELVVPPYTGISRVIPLPVQETGGYAGIAAGAGALWIAGNEGDRRLWRVDPETHRVITIRLGFAPRAIAAGLGAVWIVAHRGNALVRIDATTGRVARRIHVGRGPTAVTLGDGFVWVADEIDGTVSMIDPARNAVRRTIDVGAKPVDLAVGLGAVWIARRTS